MPVKIFFSSPADLFPERAIAKTFVAQELANYRHLRADYAFLPYAYEDEVPHIVGEEPQPTVDKYLLKPEDADIVVCLLWACMGTPTPSLLNPETQAPYHSGTEYELLTAYRQRRPDGTPHILLYPCERPATDPSFQSAEQQAHVVALLARFRQGGDLTGLVQAFPTPEGLRDRLRIGLLHVIETDLKPLLQAHLADIRRERERVYLFDGPLASRFIPRPKLDFIHLMVGQRVRAMSLPTVPQCTRRRDNGLPGVTGVVRDRVQDQRQTWPKIFRHRPRAITCEKSMTHGQSRLGWQSFMRQMDKV